MVNDNHVSSFDESGYFRGPFHGIFSDALEQEAMEEDEWVANTPGCSGPAPSRIMLTTLQEAVLANASYIHIQPIGSEFVIRYRVDGKLWVTNAYPRYIYTAFIARLKRISSINIAERRVPQFGRFFYEQSGILYEMRLSTIPTAIGEAFVLNIVPPVRQGDYTEERH